MNKFKNYFLKISAIVCICWITITANAQFKVLAFYNGTWDGGHIGFDREALAWFRTVAASNGFTFESTTNWSKLTTANLANYKLIMFLDDVCPAAQRSAFQTYMQNGGAWIGFHACAFNTNPSDWDWFYNQFLGMGAFKSNTWGPTTAILKTENTDNPINAGIPSTWTCPVSEFYGWTVDLRTKSNIKILQSIDPSAFPVGSDPNQQWTSGYYPIIWTNSNYKMMYTNIGHNLVDYNNNNTNLSFTFSNANYCNLILNAIKTLAGVQICTTYVVPGSIEAENYCSMTGIQTETTTDAGGGQDVGWIDANDQMTYKINVASSGTYKIEYRVASLNGGGNIQLDKGAGTTVYGSIAVPSTGGWQTWTTISQNINLTAGTQDLRILATSGGFNLNWLRISSVNNSATVTIQAENYNQMYGVQLETTTDAGGGQDVGWIDANDWLLYNNINIPTSGTYTIEYRVASLNGGGQIQFEKGGGSAVYGSVNIPSTGGWQSWTTIKHTVTLTAGTQSFGIKAITGGFNINWWAFTPGLKAAKISDNEEESSFTISPNPASGCEITLNLTGYPLNETIKYSIQDLTGKIVQKGINNGSKTIVLSTSQLVSGMYIISVESNQQVKTQKLVIKK